MSRFNLQQKLTRTANLCRLAETWCTTESNVGFPSPWPKPASKCQTNEWTIETRKICFSVFGCNIFVGLCPNQTWILPSEEPAYNIPPSMSEVKDVILGCPLPLILMEATLVILSFNQTSIVPHFVAVNMKSLLAAICIMSNPVQNDPTIAFVVWENTCHILFPFFFKVLFNCKNLGKHKQIE